MRNRTVTLPVQEWEGAQNLAFRRLVLAELRQEARDLAGEGPASAEIKIRVRYPGRWHRIVATIQVCPEGP